MPRSDINVPDEGMVSYRAEPASRGNGHELSGHDRGQWRRHRHRPGGVRQDWLASFESNVLTAVLLVEALWKALERDGGRVALLSSVAALRGSGGGAYGAVKAALHGFVYDLARNLGEQGGTANVVAPGFVPDTEFWAGRLTSESRRERAAQTLVGREGTPEEVASLIAWLLGPDGGWVTGQVLSPNGGVVLGR